MANYYRYIIRNDEPLRIADDSVRQSGQTETLCYIPGTTIRGLVVNHAEEDSRPALLGNTISFLNAYPTTEKHALIPSPKGFYEDKTQVDGPKKLPVNVVIKGDEVEGRKRASLGSFCYMENHCIHYYSVETDADLKIKINLAEDERDSQSVFRNVYIKPGHYFEGYVRLSGSQEDRQIEEILGQGKRLILGNGRSAGLGKCTVVCGQCVEELPYQKECFSQKSDAYMMLLSNTTMRDEAGEICGLNTRELEQVLGVKNLKVAYASSSVKQVYGYNRTWHTNTPVTTAYEAGSVFHLTFSGTLQEEAMARLVDEGIGVRRSEGFGRILFLRDYEAVDHKLGHRYAEDAGFVIPAKPVSLPTDAETLRVIARGYYRNCLERSMEKYVVEHPVDKKKLKNSQLGTVLSILTQYRYNPTEAMKGLEKYFGHAQEKESKARVQKERASINPLYTQIRGLMDRSLAEILFAGNPEMAPKERGKVMGQEISSFFTPEEEARYKIQLIINMIRFDYKGE